jgi:hypothetical protein
LWKSPTLIYEAPPKESSRRLAPPKPKPKLDETLEFSLKSSHLWAFVHPPIPSSKEVAKKGDLIKYGYEMLKPSQHLMHKVRGNYGNGTRGAAKMHPTAVEASGKGEDGVKPG